MDSAYIPLLVIGGYSVFFGVILVGMAKRKDLPAAQRIAEWARENRLQLVSVERRWFLMGPYFFKRGAGDVYKVTALDPHHGKRVGWLCLHSRLFRKGWEEVCWDS